MIKNIRPAKARVNKNVVYRRQYKNKFTMMILYLNYYQKN